MNKYETCKDCPDRTVQPNCHMTCEGYEARQKKRQEANDKRLAESIMTDFQYREKQKIWKKYH